MNESLGSFVNTNNATMSKQTLENNISNLNTGREGLNDINCTFFRVLGCETNDYYILVNLFELFVGLINESSASSICIDVPVKLEICS